jgi:peptide/nickel transport system ATP-binding protein/oligopeptide transport system ATP-binding protein
MSDVILEANSLVKTYRQRSGRFGFGSTEIKALDDVSVSLKTGSTLAVVGESGSGKSTLARCLLQLHPFDSGEVLFQGHDLAKLSDQALRDVRKHLQMVFQDPFASLNPRMRVGEIIGEGLLIHGLGSASKQKEKVYQMLERVGLEVADAQKYPHQFSGGQRQRIGIACTGVRT